MPVTLSNLRSVVAQVTRAGGRSVIVSRRNLSSTSRRRNLSSTSRRRKPCYSGSIFESGSFTAGFASVVAWQIIQKREYFRTVERDVEERTGSKSKTSQRNVLREAWQSISGRDVALFVGFLAFSFFCLKQSGGP